MIEWEAEQQYKSVINRIGIVLLLFLATSNVLGVIGLSIAPLWEEYLVPVAAQIATSLTDGVVYALSFMLPVLFFKLMSKGKSYEPMKLAPRLPRETFVYICAGLAVVSAAAYLNHYMIVFTGYADFAEETLWANTYDSPHAIAMTFITLAIVPAFVEEFLFRGLILTNLRPFGRGVAIIGSAVLFGVMHQNIQQVFYATVAGLVLGYLYELTDSIWCPILLHLVNNGLSVITGTLNARLEPAFAERVIVLIDGAVFGLGALCLIWILCRKRPHPELSEGIFEKTLPTDPAYADYEISGRRKIKLFFSPTMIAFLTMCVLTMLLLFLMSFMPPIVESR